MVVDAVLCAGQSNCDLIAKTISWEATGGGGYGQRVAMARVLVASMGKRMTETTISC